MYPLQADANPLDDHGDTYKTATDIFLNGSQTGQIGSAEDVDYFRLEITAPGELTVYTTGSLDTVGSIEDDASVFANGDQEGNGNNFSITYNASPETYYISVRGNRNATGTYTLHASFVGEAATSVGEGAFIEEETPLPPDTPDDHGNGPEAATALSFNSPQPGQINSAEDVDYFRLEITAPGELTVYTTGSLDTLGDIQDDTGTAFGDADQRGKGESNNFRIVHNAKPGTYYISVRGNQNATGNYTLHASFVPNEEQFAVQPERIVADPEGIVVDPEGIVADPDSHHTRANAISVTLGRFTTGTNIGHDDIDYFLVQVPTPRTIIAETGWRKSGESPDLIGELQNRSGSRITSNDDGGFDRNFRIVRHVGSGGTYYIKVRGFNNRQRGAYTFYVHDNVNEPGPRYQSAYTLPLNRSVGEAITFYGDVDYYRISVPAYGKLVVETTGSTDTYGQLRNSSDSLVTSNDDSGVGANFRISRIVTSGTYYIRVRHFRRDRGGRGYSYTIRANFTRDDHRNTRSGATTISLNGTRSGRIDYTGDEDYFRLQINAPIPLTVYTTGSTDTIGRLYNSSGSLLSSNNNSGAGNNFKIVYDVAPGTYYIRVDEYLDNSTGSYTLHTYNAVDDHSNTRTRASPLSLHNPLTASINPGNDVDYFRVQVGATSATTALIIETTGITDTYGQLENSNGSTLTSNDDGGAGTNFRISRSVTSGTYYIRVSSYGSRTGTYTLLASIGQIDVDVNGDGTTNVSDLVVAAGNYGLNDASFAQGDVNGDNTVDRADIMAILDVLDDDSAGAPSVHPTASLQRWIDAAKQLNNMDLDFQKGIAVLEQLLAQLIEAETIPTVTAALPNYPNPFNPETWIPYQLAEPADVAVTIYDVNGHVVRYLDVGHQRAGLYHSRSRATHWDGRNAHGESVASGVYFYTLKAGEFTVTRKMLIRK